MRAPISVHDSWTGPASSAACFQHGCEEARLPMSGRLPASPSSSSSSQQTQTSFLSLGLDNFLGMPGKDIGRKVLAYRYRFDTATIGNFLQFAKETRVHNVQDYIRRLNDDELYVCNAREDRNLIRSGGQCAYLGDMHEILQKSLVTPISAAKYSMTIAAQRWDAGRERWTAKRAPYIMVPTMSPRILDLPNVRRMPNQMTVSEYAQGKGYYPLGMPPDHGGSGNIDDEVDGDADEAADRTDAAGNAAAEARNTLDKGAAGGGNSSFL